jgi:hypothetical protein
MPHAELLSPLFTYSCRGIALINKNVDNLQCAEKTPPAKLRDAKAELRDAAKLTS